jgi:prepilin-type N-terminal cleavage/methylation domain-containing protein
MRQNAFTMVEILVAMATIAVLLGLAVFGISELTKNSRDKDRLNTLTEMINSLNDYKRQNLNYPSVENVSFSGSSFSINGDVILELQGHKTPGLTTDSSQTKYNYIFQNGKIGLCADLESGVVENVGDIKMDDC